jgi:PAS domain-containing protein
VAFNDQTAAHLVDAAARAVESSPDGFHAILDDIPAPIYVTDADGTITYFNEACVGAAGRLPQAGVDQWCVTWKLYTTDGERMPHDSCPMAVAIKEGREVRGVEIVAERPDGSRGRFVPYPTPTFDADGALSGAVNLLIDITEQPQPAFFQAQAERCRELATAVDDPQTAEMLALMAAKYYEQSRQGEE